MTLQVHSLASGSSGNAMLVCGEHSDLLLDCGMPRRFLEAAILAAGSTPDRLSAILLTHEHIDHTRGLLPVARRTQAPVFGSAGTLDAALCGTTLARQVLHPLQPAQVGEFVVTGLPVSHDAREPFAFSVLSGRTQLCYAVDLGSIPDHLIECCLESSLVVLEANHDVSRLLRGPYTTRLKRRILSDTGHLSNETTASVISAIAANGHPVCFWLAHLSAINNSPGAALQAVRPVLKGRSHCSLEVARRDRPSLRWSAGSHWWQPSLLLDW